LQASNRAASVELDTSVAPATDPTGANTVEAVPATTLGRSGTGTSVAILDTGIDASHPYLTAAGHSKVVYQACFSQGASCPNGSTTQVGTGAGVPCKYSSECIHGTHVAGIVAGMNRSMQGVAPGTQLLSYQVFSRTTQCSKGERSPCARAFSSDELSALDDVATRVAQFHIASVNMSLGSGHYTSSCDGEFQMFATAFTNLRSLGVAPVVASGNGGFTDGIAEPACVSTAVSVGSVSAKDTVSTFSNSSPMVDLLAPGENIKSSVPGGSYKALSGTSMATPQVAGAFAVLHAVDPTASVDTELSLLEQNGKLVTDARNGVTDPRIRVLTASANLLETGLSGSGTYSLPGGGVVSVGVGLAHRAGGPSSATAVVPKLPKGAQAVAVALYYVTNGGLDDHIKVNGTDHQAFIVGAAGDTCWGLKATYTYRLFLPTSLGGSGKKITIGGLSYGSNNDAEGASVVVIYKVTSVHSTTKIVVRYGADVIDGPYPDWRDGSSIGFSGLNTGAGAVSAQLNLAAGDGQSFPDNPLLFNGNAITGANEFGGADGPMWDDLTIPISPSLLPAGATGATVSNTLNDDCLVFPYAALSYVPG
jgi:subtilisin family serine protease